MSMLFQINYSSTTTLCCRREEEDSVLSPKCSSIRDEKSFFRRKKKHVGLLTDMMLLALSRIFPFRFSVMTDMLYFHFGQTELK